MKKTTTPQPPKKPEGPIYNEIIGTENGDYLGLPDNSGSPGIADHIKGLGGNDIIYGNGGNDWLEGGDGSDHIYGGRSYEDPNRVDYSSDFGSDILDGGAGNDYLAGGVGADTYIWGKGYGNDQINEVSINSYEIQIFEGQQTQTARELSANKIQLVNLKPRDIEILGSSYGVTLKVKSTGETLQFSQSNLQDLSIEFSNGDKWDTKKIVSEIYKNNNGNDKIYGFTGAENELDGGNGDDFIRGGQSHDVILGGRGNDDISGQGGDDIIRGGAGRDTLAASYGADKYEFGYGSGTDVLITADDSFLFAGTNQEFPNLLDDDSIVLDNGIKARDVKILQQGNSLIVELKGKQDRFEIDNILGQPTPNNFHLTFSDGTQWDLATLQAKAKQDGRQAGKILNLAENQTNLAGTLGNDIIIGNVSSNTILGRAGNDYIDGKGAKGGADIISGGEGKDTIFYDRGYGHTQVYDAGNDTIKFAKGITVDDITTHWDFYGYNLNVNVTAEDYAYGQVDHISIKGFDVLNPADGEGTIIEFADGTRWTQKEILDRRYDANNNDNVLFGTSGNDVIDGLGGYDQIFGMEGDDTLHGGAGWDEVYGGLGNDKLYADADGGSIYGGGGNDLLVGSDGDDSLSDTESEGWDGNNDDTFIGNAGNDSAADYYGNDIYDMGAGDDRISDNNGTNTIILKGDFGHDTLETYVNNGNNFILDLEGTVADYQFTLGEFSGVSLQKGDNVLAFNKGVNEFLQLIKEVRYSDGTVITGDEATEFLISALIPAPSLPSDDVLTDSATSLIISGGDGNDTITTANSGNYLLGGNGKDTITGSDGYNFIAGGNGDDIINSSYGDDIVFGGAGNDTITGTGYLLGNGGNDTLTAIENINEWGTTFNGGEGNDQLTGNKYFDTYAFDGQFGDDTIIDTQGVRLLFAGKLSDYSFSLNNAGNFVVDHGEDSVTVLGNMRENFTVGNIEFSAGYLDLEQLKISLGVVPTPAPATTSIENQTLGLIDAMAAFKTASAESSISQSVVDNHLGLLAVSAL